MTATYDTIGTDYNLTRKADPYLVERLYKYLKPKANGTYLDIGCGTGNYTIALQQKGLQFIGVDPSKEMLAKAKAKNRSIVWKQGKAEAIPLKNESVNGVIASLTLHHWNNLDKGFKDLYRILKPTSRFVMFTSTPDQMKGYWLNDYFPKMLQDSMSQMPSYDRIEKHLTHNGFKILKTEPFFVPSNLSDLFLYAGKERPELYLDIQVRNGISSFASLANKTEVEQGLSKLEKDIESGNIRHIMDRFTNENGDYLFIVAEK
ncbi:MAG: class I SAM-dependent methyltransferase [Gelidibacter sp.]